MAEFNMNCPRCNAKLTAEEEWIGMVVECPQCKHTFSIRKNVDEKAAKYNDTEASNSFDEQIKKMQHNSDRRTSSDIEQNFQNSSNRQEKLVIHEPISDADMDNNPDKKDGSSKQDFCHDKEEDDFVIDALDWWKVAIWPLASIGAIGFLIACIDAKKTSGELALILFVCGVSYVISCIFLYLVVCWMRGIYRNLVWSRIIAQTMYIPERQVNRE